MQPYQQIKQYTKNQIKTDKLKHNQTNKRINQIKQI